MKPISLGVDARSVADDLAQGGASSTRPAPKGGAAWTKSVRGWSWRVHPRQRFVQPIERIPRRFHGFCLGRLDFVARRGPCSGRRPREWRRPCEELSRDDVGWWALRPPHWVGRVRATEAALLRPSTPRTGENPAQIRRRGERPRATAESQAMAGSRAVRGAGRAGKAGRRARAQAPDRRALVRHRVRVRTARAVRAPDRAAAVGST
jgi:hypothetical protein